MLDLTILLSLLKEGGWGIAVLALSGLVWMYLSKETLREQHAVERKGYADTVQTLNDKRLEETRQAMDKLATSEASKSAMADALNANTIAFGALKDRVFELHIRNIGGGNA